MLKNALNSFKKENRLTSEIQALAMRQNHFSVNRDYFENVEDSSYVGFFIEIHFKLLGIPHLLKVNGVEE